MNEQRAFEEVQAFPWWTYALLFGTGIAPLGLLLLAPWLTGRDLEVGLPAVRSLIALLPVWLVLGNLLCMRTVLQADTLTVSFGCSMARKPPCPSSPPVRAPLPVNPPPANEGIPKTPRP